MVKDIKNNTNNSEALAKQKLNAQNEIKKAETKNKRLINGKKILLSLTDDLIETIFNNNNNNNNNSNNNSSNNNNNNENHNESVKDNDVNDDNDDHDEEYYKIKQINNWFKTIDKTKSFEQQTEILKTRDVLDEYWHDDYHDDKEVNIKILKAKVGYILMILKNKYLKKYLVTHL